MIAIVVNVFLARGVFFLGGGLFCTVLAKMIFLVFSVQRTKLWYILEVHA